MDTSVWVNHLRHGVSDLKTLLNNGQVLVHPFVIGELSCGNLKNREKILDYLNALPSVSTAQHEEVLELIEMHRLMGQGLGWIDAHLLASALISGAPLWTADKKLRALCATLGVLF